MSSQTLLYRTSGVSLTLFSVTAVTVGLQVLGQTWPTLLFAIACTGALIALLLCLFVSPYVRHVVAVGVGAYLAYALHSSYYISETMAVIIGTVVSVGIWLESRNFNHHYSRL